MIATDAYDALSILGNEATQEETRVLGAFHYVFRYIFLLNLILSNYYYWVIYIYICIYILIFLIKYGDHFIGSTNILDMILVSKLNDKERDIIYITRIFINALVKKNLFHILQG